MRLAHLQLLKSRNETALARNTPAKPLDLLQLSNKFSAHFLMNNMASCGFLLWTSLRKTLFSLTPPSTFSFSTGRTLLWHREATEEEGDCGLPSFCLSGTLLRAGSYLQAVSSSQHPKRRSRHSAACLCILYYARKCTEKLIRKVWVHMPFEVICCCSKPERWASVSTLWRSSRCNINLAELPWTVIAKLTDILKLYLLVYSANNCWIRLTQWDVTKWHNLARTR